MKKLITIFALSLCIVSCQKNFLDTSPRDGIGSSSFWGTEEHALLGITAIYSTLNTSAYYTEIGMDDVLTPIGCRLSNDGWDDYNLYSVYRGTANARTSYFAQRWKMIYRGVMRANDAINNLPHTPVSNPEKLNRFIAEAKFLRALFYFDLLNFYGGQDDATDGGVPLYLEVVNYKDSYQPRSKPSVIRQQILKDLMEAIPDLPSAKNVPSSESGRATQGAAKALLGKTYLYNKEWSKASDVFSELIQQNEYQLHPNYLDLFQVKGEQNKEVIFDMQAIAISGTGTWMDIRYGNASSGSRAKNASVPTNMLIESYGYKDGTAFDKATFLQNFKLDQGHDFSFKTRADVDILFKDRDPRLKMSVILPFTTFVGIGDATFEYRYPGDDRKPGDGKSPAVNYLCMKTNKNLNNHYVWRKFVDVGDDNKVLRFASPINVPIIRYADVLLMFAEARNEASPANSANLTDSLYWAVNQVRGRQSVGMPGIALGSQDIIRKAIQKERMIELAGEGIYYSDIRRWNKGNPDFNVAFLSENVMDLEGKVKIESRAVKPESFFLWPIPMGEVEMNPALLPQNPGWEM